MQGTAIPYLDMGAASIKMNDDGSFNLLIGATDLGTGSDTVLAQMAAEVLGVPMEDVIVYSSDTDFTPFDKGAYASSTTYVSGAAVTKAAEQAAVRIRLRAARMLNERVNEGTQQVHLHKFCRKRSSCAMVWHGHWMEEPQPGGDCPPCTAPCRPGADHGGCFVYVAGLAAALCCPVR